MQLATLSYTLKHTATYMHLCAVHTHIRKHTHTHFHRHILTHKESIEKLHFTTCSWHCDSEKQRGKLFCFCWKLLLCWPAMTLTVTWSQMYWSSGSSARTQGCKQQETPSCREARWSLETNGHVSGSQQYSLLWKMHRSNYTDLSSTFAAEVWPQKHIWAKVPLFGGKHAEWVQKCILFYFARWLFFFCKKESVNYVAFVFDIKVVFLLRSTWWDSLWGFPVLS